MPFDPVTAGMATAQAKLYSDATAKRLRGRQSVADSIAAPVMANPPILTYNSGANTTDGLGDSPIGFTVQTIAWDDTRLTYLGGTPVTDYSAGSMGSVQVAGASGPARNGRVSYCAFDFDGSILTWRLHSNTAQYLRLWVDGRPHAAAPVQNLPAGGFAYYQLGVDFTTAARRSLIFELESGLWGGFRIPRTTSIYARSQG